MNYLLDTNVLSELRQKKPDPSVVEWFERRPPASLYLSVLTLGELRKGVEGLADPKRRQALLAWLETDLPKYFTGRSLMSTPQSLTTEEGCLREPVGQSRRLIVCWRRQLHITVSPW